MANQLWGKIDIPEDQQVENIFFICSRGNQNLAISFKGDQILSNQVKGMLDKCLWVYCLLAFILHVLISVYR